MRRTPSFEPPAITKNDAKVYVETRRYKLITPLFGGGVKPQTADPLTVIRASEIRGHLRFWWRATRGGQYSSLERLQEAEAKAQGDKKKTTAYDLLRDAEGALWGDTARPSPISIEVNVVQPGQPEVAFTVKGSKPEPSANVADYAAFPLLPTDDDRKKAGWQSKPVRVGVEFTVTFRIARDAYERHNADLEAALWAWETFGGVGGRTRRGFGALQRVDGGAKLRDRDGIEKFIREGFAKHVVPEPPVAGVPHLTPEHRLWRLTKNAADKPIEAWKSLIKKLKDFRQYRLGKDGKQSEYGKSVWPEPDVIRNAVKGKRDGQDPSPFPRAVFGLPIIFHFPQDRTPDATLVGTEQDRLASPLILRPIALEKGAVGLALVLSTPRRLPDGLRLESDKGGYSGPVSDRGLTKAEAQQVTPLKGKTDVLEAFLDWV